MHAAEWFRLVPTHPEWWLKAGYFALTLMFAALTVVYTWATLSVR